VLGRGEGAGSGLGLHAVEERVDLVLPHVHL
jgi:hypothetical protein